MRAKAIVFTERNTCVLEDIALPDPTPRDIVVQSEVCGVSVGTERWAFIGKRREIGYPNVPGYMGVGRVVEVGAEAAKCGYRCDTRVHFLRSRLPEPYGENSWMGSHVSVAVVDVVTALESDPDRTEGMACEVLPERLDPLDASLAGLAGVALQGTEMAVIPAGHTVLVAGLGVLGQYVLQASRLKGARVTASDPVPMRLDVARDLGAARTINPSIESLAESAGEVAPDGFDVIIDTSSIPEVVMELMPLLKYRGKLVFQGFYPPPSVMDLATVASRMPTCFFPNGHNGRHVAAAVQWMADGVMDTRRLITHTPGPDEAPEIYRMIAEGSQDFLGVVFDWRR